MTSIPEPTSTDDAADDPFVPRWDTSPEVAIGDRYTARITSHGGLALTAGDDPVVVAGPFAVRHWHDSLQDPLWDGDGRAADRRDAAAIAAKVFGPPGPDEAASTLTVGEALALRDMLADTVDQRWTSYVESGRRMAAEIAATNNAADEAAAGDPVRDATTDATTDDLANEATAYADADGTPATDHRSYTADLRRDASNDEWADQL